MMMVMMWRQEDVEHDDDAAGEDDVEPRRSVHDGDDADGCRCHDENVEPDEVGEP